MKKDLSELNVEKSKVGLSDSNGSKLSHLLVDTTKFLGYSIFYSVASSLLLITAIIIFNDILLLTYIFSNGAWGAWGFAGFCIQMGRLFFNSLIMALIIYSILRVSGFIKSKQNIKRKTSKP